MDDLLSIAVSNAVAATVLALAASAVGALCRRPALVHGLWLLVLLKLVTPPLVFIPIAWPRTAEQPLEIAGIGETPTMTRLSGVTETTATDVAASAGADDLPGMEVPLPVADAPTHSTDSAPEPSLWPQVLRLVWGFGALTWFLLALERLHHFRRLLRFARPAPAALQERTRQLARSLGLRRCPRVRLMPGRIAPMLWSVGGPPRLLVPADLLDVLSEEQLDTLLVHELAHLRRRDHWVRVLEFVVMGLYWWHPVVWYARRELHEAEEQCCDAWVVSTLPGTGRTYASALLDTVDFLSTTPAAVPPLASGLSQIADLKRRLRMILQGTTPRSLTWPGCLAVVALGLTLLPMLPSLHGEPPGKEEGREQIDQAEKELQRAKAALERQKAELTKQMKELARAEQNLVRESARKAMLEKARTRIALREIDKRATYRIEITLPEDAGANPKEIVEKIRKALPEELRGKVILRPVPQGQRNIDIDRGGAAPGAAATPPRPPKRLAPPQPDLQLPLRDENKRGPSSSDKRINDLEKKLEKVLRELQELRKQMKQPRGNGYSAPEPVPAEGEAPPATPVPPAPPNAPPPRRFRLVPSSNQSPTPAPVSNPPSSRNPYYAPTVPLVPSAAPSRP